MTRRDVQGYVQDLIALSESQQAKSGKNPQPPKPKTPRWPGPVRLPTSPLHSPSQR